MGVACCTMKEQLELLSASTRGVFGMKIEVPSRLPPWVSAL